MTPILLSLTMAVYGMFGGWLFLEQSSLDEKRREVDELCREEAQYRIFVEPPPPSVLDIPDSWRLLAHLPRIAHQRLRLAAWRGLYAVWYGIPSAILPDDMRILGDVGVETVEMADVSLQIPVPAGCTLFHDRWTSRRETSEVVIFKGRPDMDLAILFGSRFGSRFGARYSDDPWGVNFTELSLALLRDRFSRWDELKAELLLPMEDLPDTVTMSEGPTIVYMTPFANFFFTHTRVTRSDAGPEDETVTMSTLDGFLHLKGHTFLVSFFSVGPHDAARNKTLLLALAHAVIENNLND